MFTGIPVGRSFLRTLILTVVFASVGAPLAHAGRADEKAPFDVRAHYTKYEYRIPMRDGVKLFTAVYVPKDISTPYPFLLLRTPYTVAPYGVDHYRTSLGPTDEFAKAGYIFVYQDVRGRGLSEGQFREMTPHLDKKSSKTDVDESSDTYDTMEWLLKNIPNHNGNAGIWGISYPGFYTSASIIDSHPAIKAASPQAPVIDLYMGDDAYHGGAFMLAGNFGFYTFFKPQEGPTRPAKNRSDFDYGTQDGYEFFLKMGSLAKSHRYFGNQSGLWDDQLKHTTYDDYWKIRNLAPHLKNIHCAVLTVGGWFDAEDLSGPLKTYRTIEANDPGIFNALVMGPWVHGGWGSRDGRRLGSVDFASETSLYYREHILFPFFEQYLKGKSEAKLPKAYVFETGTNAWRQYAAWPPVQAKTTMLYFHPNGGLSFGAPQTDKEDFDEYVSDPAKPVPFIGYQALDVPQEYMVADQRFASIRPDAGTDSDWVVKLIDVYPPEFPGDAKEERKQNDVPPPSITLAGYQQLVRGEPIRGKFRHSFEKPEPFVPGKVEEIDITMPDINHTFRRGHRIMVQVQSSWFPLIDLNPQTFLEIPEAKPTDFHKATERVYHWKQQPSGIEVQAFEGPQ